MKITSIKIRTTCSSIDEYRPHLNQYIVFLRQYGTIGPYTTGFERGVKKEKAHFHTHFLLKVTHLPKTNLQQTYKYYCKTKNLKITPGKYTLSIISEKAESEENTLAYPLKNVDGPLGLADRGELMKMSNLDEEDWKHYCTIGVTIRKSIIKVQEKKLEEKSKKDDIKTKLFKYIDEHRGDDQTIVEIGMLVVRFYFEEMDEICMYPDKWVMKYMRTKQIINDYDLFNYLTKLRT